MFPTSVTYIAELGNTRVRRGEEKQNRSRDAVRARVLQTQKDFVTTGLDPVVYADVQL
ncbi:MAG: hypothetical protein ABSD08_16595 [Xanthobacteraceae bacterium]|jgi:hypothetical protein